MFLEKKKTTINVLRLVLMPQNLKLFPYNASQKQYLSLIHFLFSSSFENLVYHFASLTSASTSSLCFSSIGQLTFAKPTVVISRERIKGCINIHFEQSTRSLRSEATNLCMWFGNLRMNVLDFGVLTDIKVAVRVSVRDVKSFVFFIGG